MIRRIPWRELVIEFAVGVAFLATPLVVGILSDAEPLLIVLATGGMVTMAIFAVTQYESWRAPLRDKILSGKELIDAVDAWLRENQYTRGPAQLKGYSHAIQVQGSAAKVWIAIPEDKNALHFITSRADSANALSTLMDPAQRLEVTYLIALEVARMGAYYEVADSPYSIASWDVLSVDETVNEAKVLSRVGFIERVDHLIQLVWGKQVTAAVMSTITPSITPSVQSTPDSGGSPSQGA